MTRLWTSAGMELGPVVLVACDVPAGRQLGFPPRAASARSPQPHARRQAPAVETRPVVLALLAPVPDRPVRLNQGPGGGATQRWATDRPRRAIARCASSPSGTYSLQPRRRSETPET